MEKGIWEITKNESLEYPEELYYDVLWITSEPTLYFHMCVSGNSATSTFFYPPPQRLYNLLSYTDKRIYFPKGFSHHPLENYVVVTKRDLIPWNIFKCSSEIVDLYFKSYVYLYISNKRRYFLGIFQVRVTSCSEAQARSVGNFHSLLL